jgi:hypothetical protein
MTVRRSRHPQGQGRAGSGWPEKKLPAEPSSMSELSASHCTARRLARVSRKAYQAGSRSGCSSQGSSLNRRKAPLPWMARASLRPARPSVIASAKSARSWYQVQDGSGSMTIRSRSSRSTGVCPVDAGVSRPERDLSRVRVDQPVMFIIGLVSQRAGDLLQIATAQVRRRLRLGRRPGRRL